MLTALDRMTDMTRDSGDREGGIRLMPSPSLHKQYQRQTSEYGDMEEEEDNEKESKDIEFSFIAGI